MSVVYVNPVGVWYSFYLIEEGPDSVKMAGGFNLVAVGCDS